MTDLKDLSSRIIIDKILRGTIDQRRAQVNTLPIPYNSRINIDNMLVRDMNKIQEFYNAEDENSKKMILIHNYIIEDGDLSKVKTVLKYYPEYLDKNGYLLFELNEEDGIEYEEAFGYSPLLACCAYSPRTKIAKFLIESKANVNFISTLDQATPLIYASQENNLRLVKLLIEYGANPNLTPIDGKNALMAACIQNNWRDNLELIRFLINITDNIDHKASNGETALIQSAAEGSEGAARELINNGANIDIKSNYGMTALMWAIEENHPNIRDMILNQQGINNIVERDM